MDMSAIVHAIRDKYSACNTYQDTGRMLRTSDDGRVRATEFCTAFRRPGCFRFDWVRSHPYSPLGHVQSRFTIRSNGKQNWFCSYLGAALQCEEVESLGAAVAMGAGICGGASVWAHQFFFPEASTSEKLLQVANVLAPDDQLSDGAICHVLRGHTGAWNSMQIWAEIGTHAIRKIEINSHGTTQEMRIDAPIFDANVDSTNFDA